MLRSLVGSEMCIRDRLCTAWYLYYSCRRSELCIVNTPLYLILSVIWYVLPENPLDRDIAAYRAYMRNSKPPCDLSRYTVNNELVRPGRGSGEVPIRIYQPQRHDNDKTLLRPVVIWFHGGGFVLGDYVEDIACTKISEVPYYQLHSCNSSHIPSY